MVKSGWLAVVFVAGIVIGVFVDRQLAVAPTAEVSAPKTAASGSSPPSTNGSSISMVTTTPATSPPPRPASTPGAAPVAGTAPAVGAPSSPEPGGDVQPIDVGPVFGKQFADSAAQGYRDAMAEAHHALEREARDESWAYSMEAEIDNSLVPETSMGNFKKEHLECRASMCELRLTARGADQAAALRRWNESLQSQPWSPQLFMSSSSVSNNDNDVDALLIFTKPPPPKKN